MTVRKAKLTDAPGIMKLWNDAVDGNYFDFWTVSSGQHIGKWTLKQTEAQILSPQFVYVDVGDEVLGFFVGYPQPLPEVVRKKVASETDDMKAERVVLWLVKVGVESNVFAGVLSRLFNYWYAAAYKRGFQWTWGTVPANSPPGSLAFARAAKPKGVIEVEDPENGWPVFYARLPMLKLTAVMS